MPVARRASMGLVFVSLLLILLYLDTLSDNINWRRRATQSMAQKVGFGNRWTNSKGVASTPAGHTINPPNSRFPFVPGKGKLKPPGANYTRVIVVPKTKEENITWMDEEIPSMEKKVYVVDDPTAPLHPPANKGHEAMVYFSYIIDHYDDLPDIMIFMHNHQRAWHNNDMLNNDAVEILERLSNERVTREGFMNLRCQWFPGCPDWIHPGNTDFDIEKTEQFLIARAWAEIFPYDPIPSVLAQPCCSQFALSKELVRSIEKERYVHYRDWILKTKLKDFISGRVWEYLWQYAFTGQNYVCPIEHICLCDGYGICFGDSEKYEDWFIFKKEQDRISRKLAAWEDQARDYEMALEEGRQEAADLIMRPEEGRNVLFQKQIRALSKKMDQMKFEAIQRGNDPKIRALESGRDWPPNDEFQDV